MADQRAVWRAHKAVKDALERGDIERPATCQNCGRRPGRQGGKAQIHAHHHRGYAAKNKLNVVWLCSICHNSSKARRAKLAEKRENVKNMQQLRKIVRKS